MPMTSGEGGHDPHARRGRLGPQRGDAGARRARSEGWNQTRSSGCGGGPLASSSSSGMPRSVPTRPADLGLRRIAALGRYGGAATRYDDRRAGRAARRRTTRRRPPTGSRSPTSRCPSTTARVGDHAAQRARVVCFLGVVRDHAEGRDGVTGAHLRGVRGRRAAPPRARSPTRRGGGGPTSSGSRCCTASGELALSEASVARGGVVAAPGRGVRGRPVRDRHPEGDRADLEAGALGRRHRVVRGRATPCGPSASSGPPESERAAVPLDLAIDLGTANTLVYARGRGIILFEPTVIALNSRTQDVLAMGNQAWHMIGRTPGPHRGRAAPARRRHHRLRDHPAPDPADLRALGGQPAPTGARARVRAVGHHPRGAARGARGHPPRRRVADLPDRAADGRGDRRRAADPRTARQHGRRHRRWHERGRGDLARRHRRAARGARRRVRPRPRDPGAPAARAQRRGR